MADRDPGGRLVRPSVEAEEGRLADAGCPDAFGVRRQPHRRTRELELGRNLIRGRIDPRQKRRDGVSDPDGVLHGHDLRRPAFDFNRGGNFVRVRVDANDVAMIGAGDASGNPDAPGTGGDAGRLSAERRG